MMCKWALTKHTPFTFNQVHRPLLIADQMQSKVYTCRITQVSHLNTDSIRKFSIYDLLNFLLIVLPEYVLNKSYTKSNHSYC